MQPESNGLREGDAWLLTGLFFYVVVNAVCFALAASGAIHPPFTTRFFFTLVAPTLGIIIVCAIQAFSVKRPFTWPFVLGFVLAMLLAAFLNLQALFSASAAV